MFSNKTTDTHILSTVDVNSSTWYYSKKPKQEDRRQFNKGRPITTTTKTINGIYVPDSEVVNALSEIRNRQEFHSAGGYTKLKHYLYRHYGMILNRKKVYRLCKENRLLLPRHKKKFKTKSPISINRIITKPMQLWELDIKYAFIIGENRFFFLMSIIDVYLRYVVGYHLGLHCKASDLIRALEQAMSEMNIKNSTSLIIRSDNGPQMISNKFLEFANANKDHLLHELIPVRTPNKNAHVESFNSIMEVEFFQNRYFADYCSGYVQTKEFIRFYHEERIHSALKYRTPNEAMELFQNGINLELKEIHL